MGADGRPFVLCCYKNESCWIHHIEQDELSHSLSFYQSFPSFFLHTAESGVFSKFFVDTLRFLW